MTETRLPDASSPTVSVLRDPANQVSPRAVALWRWSAALGWLVLFAIIAVVWLLWLDHLWWVLPAAGVWATYAVVQVIVMPRVRYRIHRWESTDTAVYTQTGWLSRERRIAPMSRVQTVDFQQTAVSRLFGLATVTVTTASAAGPLRISDIDKPVADRLVDAPAGQQTIGGLDVTVRRNAFGRQVDSFESQVTVAGVDDGPVHAVFIRAPWVEEAGAGVDVLGRVVGGTADGRIVAVRQGNLVATSFHPELTGDRRVHALFVDIVRAHLAEQAGVAAGNERGTKR